MKTVVIGDWHMVSGFALLGIKIAFMPLNPQETESVLNKCLDDPNIGMILILDRLADEIRPFLSRIETEKVLFPVIVEIPGTEGPRERADPVERLIRRAVGIDVKRGEKKQ